MNCECLTALTGRAPLKRDIEITLYSHHFTTYKIISSKPTSFCPTEIRIIHLPWQSTPARHYTITSIPDCNPDNFFFFFFFLFWENVVNISALVMSKHLLNFLPKTKTRMFRNSRLFIWWSADSAGLIRMRKENDIPTSSSPGSGSLFYRSMSNTFPAPTL